LENGSASAGTIIGPKVGSKEDKYGVEKRYSRSYYRKDRITPHGSYVAAKENVTEYNMPGEVSPLGAFKNIYPNKSKFLVFTYQGRRYKIRSVRRGNIPPMRFVEKTSEQMRTAAQEIIADAVENYWGSQTIAI
jgi:hypothetical protein